MAESFKGTSVFLLFTPPPFMMRSPLNTMIGKQRGKITTNFYIQDAELPKSCSLSMIFGNYILDGANQGFRFFFIWACRRGGVESRCIRTRRQMPPRRRAFHCNNFGLKLTTIPRDA
ncbi:MAG: hypothetical protein II899_08975 [Bacteroidales bacterium]|nr:hypothetical protein [Bacteroidales bacterium]